MADRHKSSAPRAVLAASTGGHLAQLVRLQSVLGIAEDPLWITFDHPQSRSLLANHRVKYVPYIAPRDLTGAARAAPAVRRLMRDNDYDIAISTGAAIAAVVLPIARLQRRNAWYVESVSRFDGPSLTGRLVSRIPGIETFTQHENWSDEKWRYRFSVLHDYSSQPSEFSMPKNRRMRILVTLGTIKPYRFDRLVDRLLKIIPSEHEIIWQVGETTRDDLPGIVHRTIPAADLQREILAADAVVSHAGVGSAMQIMDLGKCPVLVPRRSVHGEHVDDHQEQIARELSNRDLAVSVDASDMTFSDLLIAAGTSVNAEGSTSNQILKRNVAPDSREAG